MFLSGYVPPVVLVVAFLLIPFAPAPAASIPPGDSRIADLGRTDRSDPACIRFNWPASGVCFAADGAVGVELSSTDPGYRLGVVIDGVRGKDIECPHPSGKVWIPLEGGTGPHAVELRLVNENHHRAGSVGFLGMETGEGTSLGPPPPGPTRRILFVGDSFVAGYGALAEAPAHPSAGLADKMAMDDCLLAFPALVARGLDADYAVVARSGYGVWGTLADGSGRESLRTHLREAVFGSGRATDPAAWRPDLVVVRLGANDFSSAKKDPKPTPEQFAAAWDELVGTLRADYPGVRIEFLVVAKGGAEDWHALVKAGAGRLGCGFIETTIPQSELGLDWHLTRAGHARVADAVLAAVRDGF